MKPEMKKCESPICQRAVLVIAKHCCQECQEAHEKILLNPDHALVLCHTDPCNSRHMTRGDYSDV